MNTKLVLDTSIFVNPASSRFFGSSPTQSLLKFLELAKNVVHVEFFMPPSIYAELMHFAQEGQIPKNLLLILQKRPPKKHETKIPGFFIYELVESMRDRIDRGLRLSERHVREALDAKPPVESPSPSNRPQRLDAEPIARLRENYRRIMREGLLDSRADVDLLLLAYELDALLVSADEGVLAWAENLGVSILSYDLLPSFLDEHAGKTGA